MNIPKLIHQTISNKNHLHQDIINNTNKIKHSNKEFSYCIYDDSGRVDFIKKHYEEKILKLYLSINPQYGAARADFFRYLLIYIVGGIYLDIKSSATTPFEKIIRENDKIILSQWSNNNSPHWEHIKFNIKHEWQQWFLISEPGHPYVKNVIDLVINKIETYNPFIVNVGKIGVLNTTGPIPYTHGINADFSMGLHRVIDSTAEGLVYSIFQSSQHSKHTGNYRNLTSPVILNNYLFTSLHKFYSIPRNLKRWRIQI